MSLSPLARVRPPAVLPGDAWASRALFPKVNTTCAAPGAATGFALANQYLVDGSGEQVTEFNGAGTWQHSNAWAGSKLKFSYDSNGMHFQIADPLGTRRVQTNVNGQIEATFQSLPFGDGLTTSLTSLGTADDATENHFTGKERDTESGNDYFLARYYGSSMGRFLSPDDGYPDDNDASNPQSWNLYSYVQNNPLTNTDPDGHDCVTQTRTSATTETVSVRAEPVLGVQEMANQRPTLLVPSIRVPSKATVPAGSASAIRRTLAEVESPT